MDSKLLFRLVILSLVFRVGKSRNRIGQYCEQEAVLEECKYNVYCSNYNVGSEYYEIDQSLLNLYHNCSNSEIYISGYRTTYRVNLIFEVPTGIYPHMGSIIYLSNDGRNAIICSIDLSNQHLSHDPLPEYGNALQGLTSLNFSNNAFESIKLSGKYDMPSLIEIDYSHNTINSIEINHDGIDYGTGYSITKYPYQKLKKINLSHNYLTKLPDAVFQALSELEHLDLSHNFIDTLDTQTFEGITNLIVLKLGHNRISEINQSLLWLTKLEVLDLSHNEIDRLNSRDVERLSHLTIVDLSFNSLLIIDKDTFDNFPTLKILNINDNKLNIIETNMFAMTVLQSVDLSNNNFKNLPLYLFKDKKLSYFCVKGNQIEGPIIKGMFYGLVNVTELDLGYQQLTSVESFAFFGLHNLETLLLNNNLIQTISMAAFKTPHNINTLDLSNNQLTNIDFDKDDLVNLQSLMLQNNFLTHVKYEYFKDLHILKILDISNNNITDISPKSFGSLRNLENFKISKNPLSGALKPTTLYGLNSLPSLDISGTKLNVVENGSFYGMLELESLCISHSAIEHIEFSSFTHTGGIKTLDLSENKLETFNVDTSDLFKLSSLILNNNFITHVSLASFRSLTFLSFINLAHNNITEIDSKAFNDQHNLLSVDISYNPVINISLTQFSRASSLFLSGIHTNITFKHVPFGSSSVRNLEITNGSIHNLTEVEVKRLITLENLVLRNNKLQKVEAGVFSNMTNLELLDLSVNQINYIQPGAFKDCVMLKTLNVSRNSIMTVAYGVFRGLTNLRTVDVSFNRIRSLKKERFYEVPRLSNLIADYNRIQSINLYEFSGLEILSIGGNPIPCDMIVKLINQQSVPFVTIKAITLDEHNGENVNGIRCNMEDSSMSEVHTNPRKYLEDDKILLQIRDAIYNISTINNFASSKSELSYIGRQLGSALSEAVQNGTAIIRDENNKTGQYVAQTIEKENNKTEQYVAQLAKTIEKENNKTGQLVKIIEKENNEMVSILYQILNSVAVPNVVLQSSPIPTILPTDIKNISADSLIPYINKVKQDLEDTIVLEKQKLENMKQNMEQMEQNMERMKQNRDEIENKIFKPNKSSSPSSNALTKSDAKETQSSDSKSFVFMESCMALILIVLVCFMLYKFYNSGMFVPRRRSQSTRTLPQDENSVL